MTGRNYIPDKRIADFVDSILVIENTEVKKYPLLPLFANGKPTLLFQTTKISINNSANYLTLFGQTILPQQIEFNDNYVLIAYFFKPTALSFIFNLSARELTDNPVNLNLIHQSKSNLLQDKLLHANSIDEMLDLLNDYIFSMTVKIKTDHNLIKHATTLIEKKPTKEILRMTQEKLCITERTFQRIFENEIGVSPNQFRRIVQFNSAFNQINLNRHKLLTDIAYSCGYADQSHFIRAFREFTNMTPSEYLRLGNDG